MDDQRRNEEIQLLARIREALPRMEDLLRQCSDHWGYEDHIYRFYHQSFKVFGLQASTTAVVDALQDLAPHLTLNDWFSQIVVEGTGKEFSISDNQRWTEATRPILEAFFHARFFLEMVCRYGRELDEPPATLPSGWAAVLYLYGLR